MGNPYFEPFVMADGTRRRPLVKRAPECLYREPDRGYLRFSWLDDRWGAQWYICAPDAVPAANRMLSEASAVALSRMACQDWLRLSENGGVCGLLSDNSVEACVPDLEKVAVFGDFQTLDENLCHAAHARADAKGIAP